MAEAAFIELKLRGRSSIASFHTKELGDLFTDKNSVERKDIVLDLVYNFLVNSVWNRPATENVNNINEDHTHLQYNFCATALSVANHKAIYPANLQAHLLQSGNGQIALQLNAPQGKSDGSKYANSMLNFPPSPAAALLLPPAPKVGSDICPSPNFATTNFPFY